MCSPSSAPCFCHVSAICVSRVAHLFCFLQIRRILQNRSLRSDHIIFGGSNGRMMFSCFSMIHALVQVEGLLPLWTESILFDHMPHVFHRETVRYTTNMCCCSCLVSETCVQISSNEGARCVACGHDWQRAHKVALFKFQLRIVFLN